MPEIAWLSQERIDLLTKDRRWLHAHPEIGYDLPQTSGFVRNRLDSLGIPYEAGIAESGLVAKIRGTRGNGPAIGFRADMDALPFTEKTNKPYASKTAGRMHGCGHDGHTAMLLGLAERLAEHRVFAGTVYLIFQPAEEGQAGGQRMVEEGLFDRFPMDRIFALHNWPDLPPGVIGALDGPIMASSHRLDITLRGSGGHGGMPHKATPLMSAAAHVQLALDSYLAQQVDACRAIVISLTQIESTEAVTVLPETVRIRGAVRILQPDAAERFYREIPRLIDGIATGFGATAEIDLQEVYPTTSNDARASAIVRKAAENLGLRCESEATGLDPSLASEDFSFMLNTRPGAYFWLGQGGGTEGRALHAPTYDFNDEIIGAGVAMFAEIARLALSDPAIRYIEED